MASNIGGSTRQEHDMKKRSEVRHQKPVFSVPSVISVVRNLLFLCVLLCLFAANPSSAQIYSKTIFVGDVTTEQWSAVAAISSLVTNGGYYTAGTHTNYYRLSATNLAGRIPLSTNIVVIFAGNTNTSNAVALSWTRAPGINRHVIEKSYDAGASWTNWLTLAPDVATWLDTGANTWTASIYTNNVAQIPPAQYPWTLYRTDLMTFVSGGGTSTLRQTASTFGPGYTNSCITLGADGGEGSKLRIFDTNDLSLGGDIWFDTSKSQAGRIFFRLPNSNDLVFLSTGWIDMTGEGGGHSWRGIFGGMISNVTVDGSCGFPGKTKQLRVLDVFGVTNLISFTNGLARGWQTNAVEVP
jgi:hypothetical protein